MHRHGQSKGHGQSTGRHRRGPEWEDFGPEWAAMTGRGGGRRMRRGDIRTALLAVLAEGPGHGYEIITRLEEKSGGRWRPSPGSVYPTLQLFEDEGLVRSEERDGKRVYELTDAGRTEATERAERYGSTPWEGGPEGGRGFEDGLRGMRKAAEIIRPAIPPLLMAVRQVGMSGTDAQRDKALKVLQDATKEMYRIMAED